MQRGGAVAARGHPQDRWSEITGALIGIALVLSAVFLPMAFFGGSTGRDLPAVLDHHRLGHGAVDPGRPGPDAGALRHPAQAGRRRRARASRRRASSAGSTATSTHASDRYQRRVAQDARPAPALAWSSTARSSAAMAVLFVRLPTGFLPDEDQGVDVRPGAAAGRRDPGRAARRSLTRGGQPLPERTRRTTSRSVFTVAGFSFAGAGQNAGMAFVAPEGLGASGTAPTSTAPAIAGRAMQALHARSATPRSSPSCRRRCRSWATSPGFDFELEDAAASAMTALMAARNQLLGMAGAGARRWPACGPTAWTTRRSCMIDIDQAKAGRAGPDHWPTSTARSAPPGAAPTSTTSSTAAASSASICRATRPSA